MKVMEMLVEVYYAVSCSTSIHLKVMKVHYSHRNLISQYIQTVQMQYLSC